MLKHYCTVFHVGMCRATQSEKVFYQMRRSLIIDYLYTLRDCSSFACFVKLGFSEFIGRPFWFSALYLLLKGFYQFPLPHLASFILTLIPQGQTYAMFPICDRPTFLIPCLYMFTLLYFLVKCIKFKLFCTIPSITLFSANL